MASARRSDGEGSTEHQWEFWGDDPYVICDCGEIQDALTGIVMREGSGHRGQHPTQRR